MKEKMNFFIKKKIKTKRLEKFFKKKIGVF